MSEAITRLNAALEGRYRIESELGEKPELAAVVGAERFLAQYAEAIEKR